MVARAAAAHDCLTGSLIQARVEPGDRMTAAVTGLGSVHASITS